MQEETRQVHPPILYPPVGGKWSTTNIPNRKIILSYGGVAVGMLLRVIALASGSLDTGFALTIGVPLILGAWNNYQELEGADYIVTHYKREDAIKKAMEMAKNARNWSIGVWLIGGFFFYWALAVGPISTSLI